MSLPACLLRCLQQGGQPLPAGGLHHETSLSRHQQLLVQQQQAAQMDGRRGLASDAYGSGAYSSGLAGSGGSSQMYPTSEGDFVVRGPYGVQVARSPAPSPSPNQGPPNRCTFQGVNAYLP